MHDPVRETFEYHMIEAERTRGYRIPARVARDMLAAYDRARAGAHETAYNLGRQDVLDAITYVGSDGGLYNSKLDHVDLREFL